MALPLPALLVADPGGFESWMRSRGKLGGQNKVPRMDNSGVLTLHLEQYLRDSQLARHVLQPGNATAH